MDVSSVSGSSRPYDAYLILDFEATCIKGKIVNQEIIEFPLVVVDAYEAVIKTEFQRFVRPVVNPQLDPFCTELTGISQSTVDQADPFPVVFAEVLQFLHACGFEAGQRRYCVVTCGDWDLRTMLPLQRKISLTHPVALQACPIFVPPVPYCWNQWCNIKRFACSSFASAVFSASPPLRVTGMRDLLQKLELPHIGREHSGIDDCRNIASIVCTFLRRGCPPLPTYDVEVGNLHLSSHFSAPESRDTRKPGCFNLHWPPSSLRSCKKEIKSIFSETTESSVCSFLAANKEDKEVTLSNKPSLQKESNLKESLRERGDQMGHMSNTSSTSWQPIPFIPVVTDSSVVSAALEALVVQTKKPKPHLVNTVSVSKALSHILRHSALEKHIPISVNGFVRVADIVSYKGFPLRSWSLPHAILEIAHVVKSCRKQRFTLGIFKGFHEEAPIFYICANQGHSMPGIEVAMRRIESVNEVPVAIHGTNLSAWKLIQKCGYLSTMNRQHIHFARGLPEDGEVISGMREHCAVLLYLNVRKLLEDKLELLESANGVLLTAGVGSTRHLPLTYIEKVVLRESS